MSTQSHAILMLEDDYESMHDLKEYLEEEMGWLVELSAEEKVLDQLKTKHYDLILLDLMIQPFGFDSEGHEVINIHYAEVPWRKTGPEFLRRLRAGKYCSAEAAGTSPDVPVLLLSAVAGYSVEDELGNSVPFNGYIEKPFRVENVTERIKNLLKG